MFRKVSDFVDATEQLCCSQMQTEFAKHNHKVGDFAERKIKKLVPIRTIRGKKQNIKIKLHQKNFNF